jgi:outer membrane lipoprotein LolB
LALTGLSVWQINGKIAFLKSGSRHSANLVWKVDNDQNNQQLNLTSYLGINVLKLESNERLHTLTVDGNIHQSDDLANLIYSLTGLTLPTEALHFWLKGLAYQQDDLLTYNDITGLPDTLSSQYKEQKWQITYQGYQQVEQFSLPTQIIINQGSLVIKIVIKTWSVFPHLSGLYQY